MAPVELANERVKVRPEAGPVVLRAHEPRRGRQRPVRAGAPRLRFDAVAAQLEADRRRSVRRPGRPDHLRAGEAQQGIARAAAVDREGPPEIEGTVEADRSRRHQAVAAVVIDPFLAGPVRLRQAGRPGQVPE